MDNHETSWTPRAFGKRMVELQDEPHLLELVQAVLRACSPVDQLASEGDFLDRLDAINALQPLIDEVIRIEVHNLRRWYETNWQEIANVLDMNSRQAARQKFQHPADKKLSDLWELYEAEGKALVAEFEMEAAKARLKGKQSGRPDSELETEEAELKQAFMGPRSKEILERHFAMWQRANAEAEASYAAEEDA